MTPASLFPQIEKKIGKDLTAVASKNNESTREHVELIMSTDVGIILLTRQLSFFFNELPSYFAV
jgi:hypothetical protein